MPAIRDTRTYDNLKEAFARESQASHRYLYFAQKADIEGYPDLAALFRSVADGETGHAFGHLEFLAEVGDPLTGAADRRYRGQPPVGHRGGDLRVRGPVPRLRPHRSRGGPRPHRRVV